MSDKIKLSLENSKVKIRENKRRGTMKFTIKLTKQEAEAFKPWREALIPKDIDDDTLARQIFFTGCNAITEAATQLVKQQAAKDMLQKQKEEALKSQSQDTSVNLEDEQK